MDAGLRGTATHIEHAAAERVGAGARPAAIVLTHDQLRVKAVSGLCVADCSMMPDIVSGNTNAAAIMIGEKAGDLILRDHANRTI